MWSQWVCSRRQTSLKIQARARKMENFTFKAHRKAFLFALVIASIYAFGYAVKGVAWFFFFYHNEFFCIAFHITIGRRHWNKPALFGQAWQCDNRVSLNNSLHPLKQNWDKVFYYRPLTCLAQMCRLTIFIWSQWVCSRRQTYLKIQARERWKILPLKRIGENSSSHL